MGAVEWVWGGCLPVCGWRTGQLLWAGETQTGPADRAQVGGSAQGADGVFPFGYGWCGCGVVAQVWTGEQGGAQEGERGV